MRLDLVGERDLPVTVGRYTLLGLLGEGGMARVFRASMEGALGFKKPAAVKVVLPAAGEKGAALRLQLVQEARLGGLLNHPNVVQTFDCGELEGFPYIAMELVDGVGLNDLVEANGGLPAGAVVDIALQVARGLHHAHTASHDGEPLQIIHRDVKPSNILLRQDGVVKVMDFGIAKVAMSDALSTATGLTKGTPSYMSPEQIGAEALDPRSDLFALGAVMHYMLTGRTLFVGGSLTEVMMRIIQVDTWVQEQGVGRQADEAMVGLGAVIVRLLQRQKDARYPDAALLITDLERLQKSQPSDAAWPKLMELHFGEKLRGQRRALGQSTPSTPAVSRRGPDSIAAEGAASPARADSGFVATGEPGPTRLVSTSRNALRPAERQTVPPPAPPEEVGATRLLGPDRDALSTQTRPRLAADGPRRRKPKRRSGAMLGIGLAGGALLGTLVLMLSGRSGEHSHEGEEPPSPVEAAQPTPDPTPAPRVVVERVEPTPAPAGAAAQPTPAKPARTGATKPPPRTEVAEAEPKPKPKPPPPPVAEPEPTPKPEPPSLRPGSEPTVVAAAPGHLSIDHTPITRASLGTSKVVAVKVDGPSDTRVELWFGPEGGPHQKVDCEALGNGVWRGSIRFDAAGTTEYWIVARHADTTPRIAVSGSKASPHRVSVL
jgi:serine/threonine protein kinase